MPNKDSIFCKELGYYIDKNIFDLVVYLNKMGAETTNSCGHEGTVDIICARCTRSAMRKLHLPPGMWKIVDYNTDKSLNARIPGYVLWIIGEKPYTKHMWDRVQFVSDQVKEN